MKYLIEKVVQKFLTLIWLWVYRRNSFDGSQSSGPRLSGRVTGSPVPS
jgi:hypothetical protein